MIEEIKIGNQTWMVNNLNVNKFRNGDLIPEIFNQNDWINASEKKQPACCFYENDSKYGEIYGRLYNWFAINDPRGLAPEGWHVASNDEWSELINYVGDSPASKLKSELYWKKDQPGEEKGNNQSGFSALPGGYRVLELDGFRQITLGGLWWTATQVGEGKAFHRSILWNSNLLIKFSGNFGKGLSVRCVKDQANDYKNRQNIDASNKNEVDFSDIEKANEFIKLIKNN